VIDFLLVYVKQYQWPVFNLADSAIVVGAGLLIVEITVRQIALANSPAQSPSL
jgi:signal peptidase II